jgi:hypothetical protein
MVVVTVVPRQEMMLTETREREQPVCVLDIIDARTMLEADEFEAYRTGPACDAAQISDHGALPNV